MLENNKNAVTVIYSGGDIQVPFLFYDQDDLVVLYEITPKALGTDFTVTGAGNEAGGKVTLVTPPADGTRVTVIRKVEFTQLLQIPANGIIPEGALNRALDRIVMMVQQLEERADRAVEYPEGTDKNDVANAQNILDSIEEGQQTITNAVQVAEATLEASNAALVASNKALNDAEVKRVLVNQNGDTQVERILTEGNKQDSRVETEGNEQTTRVTNEGDKQYQRVRTLGDSKYSDLNTKHQAAVSEITELRDSSVVLMDTHKVQGVATVDAAKQQAVDTIKAMPEYLPNLKTTLHEQIVKLFKGEIVGKGGKWKCDLVGTIIPSALEWNTGYEAGSTTAIKDFSIVEDGEGGYLPHSYLGALTRLDDKGYGVIVGDSGSPYLSYSCSYVKATKKVWRVNIHPDHGDVRLDFTLGKSYKFKHFSESSFSLDQQTGTRDVKEYFLGGSTATWIEHAGTPYYDFATNKVVSHTHTAGGYRTSATFKITVHGVYDAVSPVLQIGFMRNPTDWQNIANLPMIYDAEAHTLTYTGMHSSPWSGSWSHCSWVVKMASGRMLESEEEGNVAFQVDTEPVAWFGSSDYDNFSSKAIYYHNNAGFVGFLDVISDKFPEIAPDPDFVSNSFEGWYHSFDNRLEYGIQNGQLKVTGLNAESGFQGNIGIRTEDLKDGQQYLVSVDVEEIPSGRLTINSNSDSDITISAAGSYSVLVTTDDPMGMGAGIRLAYRNIALGDVVKVSRFSVKEVSAECTLNVGYRDGKVWRSQLLGDVPRASRALIDLKLADRPLAKPVVYVRRKDGTWKQYTVGGTSGYAYCAAWRSNDNMLNVNIVDSLPDLGYSSYDEALLETAFWVIYQTRHPVWRPDMSSIDSPVVADKVYFFCSTRDQGIPFLMQDLIGHVPTGTGGSNTNWAHVTSAADTYSGLGLGYIRYSNEGIPRYSAASNNAVVVFFRLIKKNGTLWMQARFRELIQDGGNWGDCYYIDENGSDYVTTTTDDNGNVVRCGVMSYDTEIPY